MMRTALVYLVVLMLLSTFVSVTYAQESPDSPSVETSVTEPVPVPARSYFDAEFILRDVGIGSLVLLVISAVLGGVGGFGAELMGSNEQDVELPGSRTAENRVDIGFWARVILGAISAIVALYLVGPQDLITYIAVSLLGGLFGTAALKLIEGRFVASLAWERARNDQLRNTLSSSQQAAEELLGRLQHVRLFEAVAADTKANDIAAVQEGLVRLDAILKNETGFNNSNKWLPELTRQSQTGIKSV